MLKMQLKSCLLVTICVAIFTGCGEESSLVNVSGKVTLDEKPLQGASVNFQPISVEMEAPTSFAKTDEEGKFTLQTAAGEMGAVPGPHTVRISKPEQAQAPDDDTLVEVPDLIPEEYRIKGVSFTVPEDGTTEANFDIKSNKNE